MNLRLAALPTFDSIVDGAGLRTVIWCQGCIHNCPDCHNPETHSLAGGFEMSVDDIELILKARHMQQGVTFSGGEPFLQPLPLSILAKKAHKLGMDVWCYTGYKYEDLADVLLADHLLKEIDVLVDGAYVKEKRDLSLRFRGSSNQRLIDMNKTRETGEVVEL